VYIKEEGKEKKIISHPFTPIPTDTKKGSHMETLAKKNGGSKGRDKRGSKNSSKGIRLTGMDKEPSGGYKEHIERQGFLLFKVDYRWFEWGIIKTKDFSIVFADTPMHAADMNKSDMVRYVGTEGKDVEGFVQFHEMMWAKLGGLVSRIPGLLRSDVPKPNVFKIEGNLSMGGNFVDTLQCTDATIHAYRMLWFNRPVHVHVCVFGNSVGKNGFYEKREIFFKSTHDCESGTVFGPDVFKNVSGKEVTVKVGEGEVLLIPAPSCFHPLTGGREIMMGTALYGKQEGHGLKLAFSASAMRDWDKVNNNDMGMIKAMVKGSKGVQPGEIKKRELYKREDRAVSIWPAHNTVTSLKRKAIPYSREDKKARKEGDATNKTDRRVNEEDAMDSDSSESMVIEQEDENTGQYKPV